jgi:hypothetical protein
MAQAIEHLLSKCEALNSTPVPPKRKKGSKAGRKEGRKEERKQ